MENNTTQENQQQKRQRKHDLSEAEKVKALLDEIESMVNNATHIPLSGRCMVKGGDVLDCVSKVRSLFISAFAQAEGIVEQEQRIISSARDKANQMADQAEAQVNQANAESERIIKEAQENAAAMAQKAEADYNARVGQILSREEIVQLALLEEQKIKANAEEHKRRCDVEGIEIIDKANREAQKILADAQAEEHEIITRAQQWADDTRKQARDESFEAFSKAIAAISLKSQAFDQGAQALVQNATELAKVLNDSGEQLGDFALQMAKRREELFPNQNL